MIRRLAHSPPFVAGLALFAGLSVMVSGGVTLTWDVRTLQWVDGIRSAGLTDLMLALTFLGDGLIEVPFALIICAVLWRIAGRRSATALFFGALSGELLYLLAKASFQRPRPTVITQLSGAGWFSYPSGHSMMAPIIWSLAFLLLVPAVSRGLGRMLIGLAILMPVAIAASRVYLGVHYPSDVLGALALGGAWMSLWLGWSRSPATSSSASTR
jgi:undecaprenyl-diphosphatase